jgi:3-deoxy-D-manno-octulosonic-acid transferase
MMKLLYDFSMILFSLLVKLLQKSRPKIRQFVAGRKNTFQEIAKFKSENQSPIAWFHVASLGEYEQAKPVIKQLKSKKPAFTVVLSFYSPSGYENVRKKKFRVTELQKLINTSKRIQLARFKRKNKQHNFARAR